jgi:hypothetical protein
MSISGKPKIYEIPNLPTAANEGVPELLQDKYNFTSHVFPSDLGTSQNGHYAVFNINVQTTFGGSIAGEFNYGEEASPERSKVDQLRFAGSSSLGEGKGGVSNRSQRALDFFNNSILPYLPGGKTLNDIREAYNTLITSINAIDGGGNRPLIALPRSTRRITASIALHMPTPLVFNTHNVYEEISLTALAGKGIGVAASLASKRTSNLLQSVGQVGSIGAKLAQTPINPMVEILFSTTAPRQFTFEVLMAPRNETESIAMKNIIKAFRFHGAPEIHGASLGLLWIPPADFDITFFNKGQENLNILRINTCVLERIEVDYAPTSGLYSTFRNGHPVAARMSLGFRELTPVHKKLVMQGF